MTATVIRSMEGYRLDHAAQAIYDFTWNEYCAWYLELSKPVLTNEKSSEAQLRGTRQTLVRVLESLLRTAHPLMPYITEEIWQKVAPLAGVEGATIMREAYPEPPVDKVNAPEGSREGPLGGEDAIHEMEWVKEFIVGVRQIRSGMDIKPSKPLPVLLQNTNDTDKARLERNQNTIAFLARTESINVLSAEEEAPESATALVGEMKVLIPMAGLIDKDVEMARLTKEIEKKQQEVGRIEGKLSNPKFVERAPEAVVKKERDKIADIQTALNSLKEQRERISKM